MPKDLKTTSTDDGPINQHKSMAMGKAYPQQGAQAPAPKPSVKK